MYNIRNYHKIDRNYNEYEKRDMNELRIPFYPKNNSSYTIKNGPSGYRSAFRTDYYNRSTSPFNANIMNTEYSQDYYSEYLSEF